ncbi:MAG: apolipoprotein N-acyltransferase [Acidimicrobiales bacterium]
MAESSPDWRLVPGGDNHGAIDDEPQSARAPSPRRWTHWVGFLLTSGLAGLFMALSVPPWGFWPLAFIGLTIFYRRLAGLRVGRRAGTGLIVGIFMFGPTLYWATNFTYPGWVILVLLESGFLAVAAALVPAHRGRALAFPGLMVLAEAGRGAWPFGGLPMGGLDLGQVGGPLAPAARVGGHLLLVGLSCLLGVALAELLAPRIPSPSGRPGHWLLGPRGLRGWLPTRRRSGLAAAMILVVVLISAAAAAAPDGGPSRRHIRVAVVQGGGPRGFRQINVNPNRAFLAQVNASAGLHPPLDLVLWPENVLSLDRPLIGSPQAATVSLLASQLGTTVVAGVTEPVGQTRFRNIAVAWGPAGDIIGHYDKVHRVPFGEYVPWRSFFSHLADLSAVPRDAIAGHGPALLRTPAGPLGVTISYEVFYAGRARSAVQAGGQILLVPTNAASYARSQVPTQEVAAARLRAIEEGRDLAQAGPTGYSAVIDNRGRVRARSVLGRPQVIVAVMAERNGNTLYERFGDSPVLALALALALGGWAFSLACRLRRPNRRSPSP